MVKIGISKLTLATILSRLANLEEGHTSNSANKSVKDKHENDVAADLHDESYDDRKYDVVETNKGDVIYWEVTKEDFEKGLQMAEEQMRLEGFDVDNHIFWKKIKSDLSYKDKILSKVQSKFEQQIHYHKEIDKKGGH